MNERVLKALGDAKRYRLLELMAQRGYCVSALAHLTELSEPAVSLHLKLLREAGLIYGVKKGYYTHYCVDREALEAVISELSRLTRTPPPLCGGPFFGCPEAEVIRCRSYTLSQKRNREDEDHA